MFRYRRGVGPFGRLGGFAYGIYLLHLFGTAGSRILLTEIGISHPAVVFAAGLTTGVAVPILIEVGLRHSYWATLLTFGQRLKRRSA
jgi:peptidoglycan/LPS O-acetylase OafA/YrhL